MITQDSKICLIIPPSIFLLDDRVFLTLGILKVAAVLEQNKYKVDVLDLSGISNYEEVAEEYVKNNDTSIFGFTATTPQIPQTIKIRNKIKELKPESKLILGGPHITLTNAAVKMEQKSNRVDRSHWAFEDLKKNFDSLVCGDGEEAIFEVLNNNFPKVVDADDTKSPMFLNNKRLDELPWPARHLVDVNSYNYTIDGVKSSSVIFQLGCPYLCSFCSGRNSPFLRRIRTRSSQNAIDEIEYLYKNYGFKGFMCYDKETEILVKTRGFIKFNELKEDDEVCILNPLNNEMKFEIPKRFIIKQFEGDLIVGSGKNVNFAVTPEHRMWVRDYSQSKNTNYRFITAEEMVKNDRQTEFLQRAVWKSEEVKSFSIPAYETIYLGRNKGSPKIQKGERVFEANSWIQFMAWYLSEGSCYRPFIKNKGKNKGRGYRICIKQSITANPEKVKEIDEIITKLGYKHSYSSNQFHIDSRELYEYLKQFGTSYFKHVPQEFKEMSSEQIKLFIDTYTKGDGNISKTGQHTIVSYSKKMRDDLQEMVLKSNKWAYCDEKYKRITISKQRDTSLNEPIHIGRGNNKFGKMKYNGNVYCVSVSTGIILVRRNGKAIFNGQCYDDELNVNKNIIELMTGLKKLQNELGVDFKLRGFVKSEIFKEEQAKAMYDAGFRWLLTGFESGSDRILNNIKKRATKDENTRCFEIARKYGLKIKALMSIGHAGESVETINDTKEWLLKVKPDDFDCTIITPYPGSPYYDNSVPYKDNKYVYTSDNGDKLYSYWLDYTKTSDYYKGIPHEYKAYVFTDYLDENQLVKLRDDLENDVRNKLNIPFNPSKVAQKYEKSMGQSGPLPSFILKTTKNK